MMDILDIFEAGEPLLGYVNIQALAGLLPGIDNFTNFETALGKLRLGQGDSLDLDEKMQLALAFISLLSIEAPQKTAVLHLIMAIKTAPKQLSQQPANPA